MYDNMLCISFIYVSAVLFLYMIYSRQLEIRIGEANKKIAELQKKVNAWVEYSEKSMEQSDEVNG